MAYLSGIRDSGHAVVICLQKAAFPALKEEGYWVAYCDAPPHYDHWRFALNGDVVLIINSILAEELSGRCLDLFFGEMKNGQKFKMIKICEADGGLNLIGCHKRTERPQLKNEPKSGNQVNPQSQPKHSESWRAN